MKSDFQIFNQTRFLVRGLISRLLLVSGLLSGFGAQANTISDLMIVIEPDGVGYTAQHTVYTQEELTVISLPAKRKQLSLEFGGPDRNVFARAYQQNPDRLSLWSGTVFSKFKHQFAQKSKPAESSEAESSGTAPVIRRANLDDFELTIANTEKLTYLVTWILPAGSELVSLIPDTVTNKSIPGQWRGEANLLTFRQDGGLPRKLGIVYQLPSAPVASDDTCQTPLSTSDECSPDVDQDGVPDHRDICLATDQANTSSDTTAAKSEEEPQTNAPIDELGCNNEKVIVLDSIDFEDGKSYLTAKVRSELDRVAIAIQQSEIGLFEIAAHTDSTGPREKNQQLSELRADAIRHYLMLRGVGPNQVRSRGYGELRPAFSNQDAGGRAANRRIELHRLN